MGLQTVIWLRLLLVTSLCLVPTTGVSWWQSVPQVAIAAGGGGSQVTFDAATNAVDITTGQSISTTHTAAGSNRAAFVFVYGAVASWAHVVVGTATYGGTAMTKIFESAPSNENYMAAFVLAAPATGAQTVTVNFVAEDTQNSTISVVTLNGVHQTVLVGTVASSFSNTTGTTPSATVTGLVANGLVVDGLGAVQASGGAAVTQGASQTLRGTNAVATNGAFQYNAAVSTQLSSDGGIMSWTKESNYNYCHIAVEFKPL